MNTAEAPNVIIIYCWTGKLLSKTSSEYVAIVVHHLLMAVTRLPIKQPTSQSFFSAPHKLGIFLEDEAPTCSDAFGGRPGLLFHLVSLAFSTCLIG